MALTISSLRALVKKALQDEPTGDTFLDQAYDEYTQLVGNSNPYYRLIYLLAQRVQPEVYVELGVDTGLAISHAAAGSPSTRCYGIDIWADSEVPYQVAQDRAARYPNIQLVRGWTIPEAMERWVELHTELTQGQIEYHRAISDMSLSVPEQIDMLFIDAWHEARFAMREWEVYASRVPHNGIVLCDDVGGWFPEMGEFWPNVSQGSRHVVTSELHPGIAFGVILV